MGVANFISGDQRRANGSRAVEVLALHPLHRTPLIVAHRDIVEDGVACQVVEGGLRFRNVFACATDHQCQLGLVVHLIGDFRQDNWLAVADERRGEPGEEHWILGQGAAHFRDVAAVVVPQADDFAGPGYRRQKGDVIDRKGQVGVGQVSTDIGICGEGEHMIDDLPGRLISL